MRGRAAQKFRATVHVVRVVLFDFCFCFCCSKRERERTREQKCQQRLGKTDRVNIGSQLASKIEDEEDTKNDDDDDDELL